MLTENKCPFPCSHPISSAWQLILTLRSNTINVCDKLSKCIQNKGATPVGKRVCKFCHFINASRKELHCMEIKTAYFLTFEVLYELNLYFFSLLIKIPTNKHIFGQVISQNNDINDNKYSSHHQLFHRTSVCQPAYVYEYIN